MGTIWKLVPLFRPRRKRQILCSQPLGCLSPTGSASSTRRVMPNQSDEIVAVDPTAKVIAKLGYFNGIDKTGVTYRTNRNQRRRRGVSRRFRVDDKSRFRLARQHARGSLYTHPAQGRRIRAANDYGASRSSDHRDGSLQQLRSQRHRPERSSAMLSQGLRTLLLLKGAFSRRSASSFRHKKRTTIALECSLSMTGSRDDQRARP